MTHTPEHMDGLAYSCELVAQVEAEAQRSWLPWVQLTVILAMVGALVAWVVV